MEVDKVNHIALSKLMQKQRKPTRKTKAQLKAAAAAKAKARAATQARQINDLLDQPDGMISPPEHPSFGRQCGGMTPKERPQDTEGSKETNTGKHGTLCANCTEECKSAVFIRITQ